MKISSFYKVSLSFSIQKFCSDVLPCVKSEANTPGTLLSVIAAAARTTSDIIAQLCFCRSCGLRRIPHPPLQGTFPQGKEKLWERESANGQNKTPKAYLLPMGLYQKYWRSGGDSNPRTGHPV